MKTLKHHTLIYDDQCPLCVAYTGAFINSGMLDEKGRTRYEEGQPKYAGALDMQKARNEIALVDTQSGHVYYGIDSLVKVLGSRFPWVAAIAGTRPVKFILLKLYKFISFNRKVIAPSKTYLQQQCVPAFNLPYRLLYILLTALFTSAVLFRYSFLLTGLIPASNVLREFLICFGQLVFQSLLLWGARAGKRVWFDYLGNMMTVSLIGALLLLPALMVHAFFVLPSLCYAAYFMTVVAFMFYLHFRRVGYIGAPWWLSATWALYRCLVLWIIL